ncbi:MAG: vWA domain-containing protein [Sulfurovaceae bacterium]
MVYFVYPYLFWILIIPFVVLAMLMITNKSRLDRLFDPQVLERLCANKDSMPQIVRNILFFVALFLMIIAMARPVIDRGGQEIYSQGSNIVLALDISGSTISKDNYQNKLDYAKQKAKILLKNLSNDEVALTAFANNAFLISPFTSDMFALQEMLDGIDNTHLVNGATNFLAVGELIVSLSEDKPNKIAIIISDVGENEDLEDIKRLLNKNDIRLFIILTKNDSTVPDDNRDIKELADALHQYKFFMTKDRKELFYYPLSISLVLLFLSWSSLPKRIKR